MQTACMEKITHDVSAVEPSLAQPQVQVWDIWIRLFHWLLLASVSLAAVTGFLLDARWIWWHLLAGLSAASLVLARVVWGFLGSRHARFAAFLPRPAQLLAHLRNQDHRHLGHNPLGALMVMALLALIMALAISGVLVSGGWLRMGPLASDLGTQVGRSARELHETMALILLGLVILHIGGVAFESLRSRENLLVSMFTGNKALREEQDAPAIDARGGLALLLLGVMFGGLLVADAGLSSREVPRMPVAELLPAFASECTDCHMAYHPSLLTENAWMQLLEQLDDHFGEDASIDESTVAEIRTWLAGHSAETVDTAPSSLIVTADPAAPYAISRTSAWRELHKDIGDDLFQRSVIGSKSNCIACHADAETGLFSPFQLSIPTENPS